MTTIHSPRSTGAKRGSVVSARGGVIVVGGPDGSGKSTLSESLAHGALGAPVRHIHHRPGALPKRVGDVVTDPRAKPPYGPVLSVVKALYVWLDFQIGWALRVRPFARHGWVLIERGWADLLVDPLRYRMLPGRRVFRLLSSSVPSPDITLVLEAPAKELARRKSELPVEELARQVRAWREVASGRSRTVFLDATEGPEEVLRAAREAIGRVPAKRGAHAEGEWTNLPGRRSPRWFLPRGPRQAAAAALRIYQPMTVRGLIGWLSARAFAAAGGFRLLPRGHAPPEAIAEALRSSSPQGSFTAVARTGDSDMWTTLLVDPTGAVHAIGSVGASPGARARLAKKADAAAAMPPLPIPLCAPRVLARSDSVLLFEALRWKVRARPWRLDPEVAAALGTFFKEQARSEDDGPSHGDFAPWNILRTDSGWAVLDWEEASVHGGSPFHDVFHYLVQAHASFRRPSQRALIAGLHGNGWVGTVLRAYADASGTSMDDAAGFFVSYLKASIPRVDLSRPEGKRERDVRVRLLEPMSTVRPGGSA